MAKTIFQVSKDECSPIIRVEDVWFRYEDVYVLKGVSLEIERGELIIIMGPNGSGKSTLLKILAGILKPQKGVIHICGKIFEDLAQKELVEFIGYVHQNPWFHIFNSRVLDEMVFTARNLGMDLDTATNNAYSIAAKLGISDLLDRSPFALSEGEARRVVIASALVHKPLLLLLDEPTAGLDFSLKKVFADMVKTLVKSFEVSIAMATHDIDLLIMLNQAKVIVLNSGEVVFKGYIKDLLRSPSILDRNSLVVPQEIELVDRLKIDLSDVIKFNGVFPVIEKLREVLCH